VSPRGGDDEDILLGPVLPAVSKRVLLNGRENGFRLSTFNSSPSALREGLSLRANWKVERSEIKLKVLNLYEIWKFEP
jgi:hypothetical protein